MVYGKRWTETEGGRSSAPDEDTKLATTRMIIIDMNEQQDRRKLVHLVLPFVPISLRDVVHSHMNMYHLSQNSSNFIGSFFT